MLNKEDRTPSSKTVGQFFSPVSKPTINEEALRLVNLFYNQLYDISLQYRRDRIFYSNNFDYHASGLCTMLNFIIDNNQIDNLKKLFLIIKLTQDLSDYLIRCESKRFKSLLHLFMNNHNLFIKDSSSPALLTIIQNMPFGFNFSLYFVGGCHFCYNSRKYFSNMHVHYDDFIKRNSQYDYNNQHYTLEELVGEFIELHKNAPFHLAKIGKMPLISRSLDELDIPELVLDMHNLI